ncbi:MAG: UPF0158 family protein [Actinomycetota bacterium]|nr:UPF0158 family protein [Actinomycetota bacterium]
MARTWLSVTVELLGGRGEDLWPWPGRIFAISPSHTFGDLADAVNDAFARWDKAHLSMFTLADGRIITDVNTADELAGSIGGPITVPLDIAVAKVARTVQAGEEFQFTFDLGDDWTHRCVVDTDKVDPMAVLGIRPNVPLAYWGWGSIPDQYGRRWSTDDGEGRVPKRPEGPHPMRIGTWPAPDGVPLVEATELRAAIATKDAPRFLGAVTGCDIDDALQQVGTGIPMALAHRGGDAESVALSVINRLTFRGGVGDEVLAEALLAALRRVPPAGRDVSVDLEMLGDTLEGDLEMSSGGYLDLNTGEVYDESVTDPMTVGADVAIDVESDPDRWLRVDKRGSSGGWGDMSAFAERQSDGALKERMERALQGKGAFARFRDIVHSEDLVGQWLVFSADRQLGRARQFLADEGIRVC